MWEYESIESVYVRDPQTHALNFTQVRDDAYQAVSPWVVTEKIDGMNIRAIITAEGGVPHMVVKDRTDAAQLPEGMEDAVRRTLPLEGVYRQFQSELDARKYVIVYGEGFGEKIQGNPLRLAGKRFRVFDIAIHSIKNGRGHTVWLTPDMVQTLSNEIGTKAVPILGMIDRLPVNEAELDAITRGGWSQIATEQIRPEGIVCRPLVVLFDNWGKRVGWKLTYREFDKIRAMKQAVEALKPMTVTDVASTEPPVVTQAEIEERELQFISTAPALQL